MTSKPAPAEHQIEDSLPPYNRDDHEYPTLLRGESNELEALTPKPPRSPRWFEFWRFSTRAKVILGAVLLALVALIASMIWYGIHRSKMLPDVADLSAAKNLVEPKVGRPVSPVLFVCLTRLLTLYFAFSPGGRFSPPLPSTTAIFSPPSTSPLQPPPTQPSTLPQPPTTPSTLPSSPPPLNSFNFLLLSTPLPPSSRSSETGRRTSFSPPPSTTRRIGRLESKRFGRSRLEGTRRIGSVGSRPAVESGGRVVRVQVGGF